jgi:ActR/RegA family two-component response regulator
MALVWENENEQIFINSLKKSLGHASLERLEWSVNNRMYSKHYQNVNQLNTIVNIALRHRNTLKSIVTFELDK